jgi:succinate dehydrogenase (ubiquinone) flavoprotein subunit
VLRNASGSKPTAQIRLAMQKAMQSDAAVFRYVFVLEMRAFTHDCFSTQKTLDEGVAKMNDIYKSYDDVKTTDRSMIWNT